MRYVSIFYQEEKCLIFSIWHFRIFSDNKFEKIKKIDISFQFLNLNKNWMDEWHTHRKFWTLFPFDRILKHNLYFTLILSTIKRKIKSMLLFRQCCSLWHGLVFLFSAETLKLKIENCNQFSIFVCRPKHSKSLTELPKREEEGSIRTVIFCP